MEILCRATVGYGNARAGDVMLVDTSDGAFGPLVGVYFIPCDEHGKDLPQSEWPQTVAATPDAEVEPEVEKPAETETVEPDALELVPVDVDGEDEVAADEADASVEPPDAVSEAPEVPASQRTFGGRNPGQSLT